jgi:glutathione S-transferase
MITLYDAGRCPYCARVRIALAEKGIEYETVEIDLSDRPAWLYEKNSLGRVPVLEEGAFVLSESAVINEYVEERHPEPPLWPADGERRALARLVVLRFDELSKPYYALRREEEGAAEAFDAALSRLDAVLEERPFLTGPEFGLADIAYVPWLLRARDRMDVDVGRFPAVAAWLERLEARPSIAAEVELVAAS